jgi:hypothetical protein
MTERPSITDPSPGELWPPLPLEAWKAACETLHRWSQIVGKIRLTQMPWINHSWHVTLYVTPRGLTTLAIPCPDGRSFQVDFDFIDHQLLVRTSSGDVRAVALRPRSCASFYRELMSRLGELDIEVSIHTKPNELEDATPLDRDEQHASYDPDAADRFRRVLGQADRVFTTFRARFIGKCSPVHFFWGSFDLAVTRFSGRPAPLHPGGVPNLPDWVVREAYSHEVSSAGFWPGGGAVTYPAFYSYAYPEPPGFREAPLRPSGAFYHPDLREFLLPYDMVRSADSPDDVLLEFLQSTYEAAADGGRWDRQALERATDPRAAHRIAKRPSEPRP